MASMGRMGIVFCYLFDKKSLGKGYNDIRCRKRSCFTSDILVNNREQWHTDQQLAHVISISR